ncbi:MAG TPA: sigma-70 family RNA polymerase sigma factor [Candidatus Binatia bacterium]|nr:sigma-70 family RNA polymerase sigma factor [Candidatus Binatia bacterium]
MFVEGLGDAECVRRVQQGDTDSFELLVHRHQKAIFNLVYRLLGDRDEAAEITQEVFLAAFKSIHQFRGEANFSTWLYRIGLNYASTRRKSLNNTHQRHVPLDNMEIATGTVDPVKDIEHKEIQQQVQQALNSLDPEDARIILLRDLQDVSYEDVAEMLDIPVGTVKSRLHRARLALKASLTPYFQANWKA